MPQSPELTAFYQAYNEWLRKGAPNLKPFSQSDGLCMAILRVNSTAATRAEMREQFKAAFGTYITPFNTYGLRFAAESNLRRCHLNPHRIEWVRYHCNP